MSTAKVIKENLLKSSTLGYGLMSLTWRAKPVPLEQAVATMGTVMKTIPPESHIMFNVGEFYGEPLQNLKYCQTYLDSLSKEERARIYVSVKGGVDLKTFAPRGSRADVRKSLDHCLSVMPYIDIFEVARLDEAHWEETFETIIEDYIKKGKVGAYSLSEVTKEQIQKIYEKFGEYVVAAELELSMFSQNILQNGTAEYCNKIGLPIICYSPLGRGLLTGQVKSTKDVPEGDFRKMLARFSDENMKHNSILLRFLEKFVIPGERSLPQIALAWIHQFPRSKFTNTNFIAIPSGTTKERVVENFTQKTLSPAEFDEINEFLSSFVTKGDRYEFASKK